MVLDGREITPGTGHASGRALLEAMYWEQTGCAMPAIGVTDQGKPYFIDSSWQFSISHTKRHVFCALSQKRIGIDAEELDRPIRLALMDQILSPAERAELDRAEDKRLALLTFWVLKEAQAKCTGEGIKFHPTHMQFSLSDPRVRQWQNCMIAVIEEDDYVI